jgi:hypothetical protein
MARPRSARDVTGPSALQAQTIDDQTKDDIVARDAALQAQTMDDQTKGDIVVQTTLDRRLHVQLGS